MRAAVTICVMAVVVLAASAARGQTADAERLRERLASLNEQIEAERVAVAAAQREHQAAVARVKNERRELAGELVELAERRMGLDAEVNRLHARLAEINTTASEYETAAARVRRAATGLADRLRLYLLEIPGEGEWVSEVDGARGELDGDDWAGAYAELLEAADAIDAAAQRVSVGETTIRTATGEREAVRLLAVGHVGFAYFVDDRVGLALASPADASGYRWQEDLPDEVKAQLREVASAVERGESEVVGVPMDVTGRMRVEAVAANAATGADQLRAGGPVMWPLAGVALLAIVLLGERAWTLYLKNGVDDRLALSVVREARAGRVDAAAALVEGRRTTLSRTLAAMLARCGAGQHAMEDTVQEQLLNEMPRLQRFLGGIAILAAVAPLLGLLGTVTGIIETFGVIRAVGQASPEMMAGGISEALITTASGLVVAIPILLVHGVMRGRVDRIIADTEKHAATLLNVLQHDRPNGDGDSATAAEEAGDG